MIAETRIPIVLDQERTMFFNANCMVAYEEATGKFFLDTVATLYELLRPVFEKARAEKDLPESEKTPVQALDILRKIPMKELRALLWASIQEYDAKDEPSWPLTVTQVGRYLTPKTIPRIFQDFLRGQTVNSPSVAEMGESQAPPVKPNGKEAAPLKSPASSGERSIELPEGAFV